MAKKGLDLCYHQGNIDWKKVKAAGIDFIIPRTGWGVDCDGKKIDPAFVKNVQGALAAGIEVPGVYHFIYVKNMTDAVKNAQCAINAVKAAGLPETTVIWCDQQEDTVIKAVNSKFNLTTDLQRQVTETFCDYVLAQGYPTGVYLNKDYVNRVYGKNIVNKYDIWYEDHTHAEPNYPCLYYQTDWYGKVAGIGTNVDIDQFHGHYTAGTAKPKTAAATTERKEINVSKVEKYINALKTLGDGRYHYWDGTANGIGCSKYTELALCQAGIIKSGETFHAGSGNRGVLADTSRFECLSWNPAILKAGDILWSQGHHVATWDGVNGVYEASPENTHGRCDNGKTGVGHWSNHTYRNCGTGTNTWSCIYRIIDKESSNTTTTTAKTTTNTTTSTTAKTSGGLKAFINALPAIKKGSNGQVVKILQTELKRMGVYSDKIDGSAGPLTEKAIKAAQKKLGVTADGIFGPNSWTALLK